MQDEDKKVSKNRQKKVEIVAHLNEKLGKSKAIVFTNYQGVTHKQLESLKRAIKPFEAEYVVAKNSLVQRALSENKIKVEDESVFQGPTGTLLIYNDIVEPLKALAKLIKDLGGIPGVKFGIMDGNGLTSEQVLKISTLPSREVLLAQVVGGLKSPIFGLHRALNWNLQKLVMTLSAVAKAKPAIQDAAPVPAEVTVESTEPLAPQEAEVKVESVEPITTEAPDQVIIETQPTEDTQNSKASEGGEN